MRHLSSVICGLVIVCCAGVRSQADPAHNVPRAARGSLFVPNKGQWDSSVRYRYENQHAAVWFGNDGIYYHLSRKSRANSSIDADQSSAVSERLVSRVRLLNGDYARPIITGAESSVGTSYFRGNDPSKWHRKVPGYSEITYSQVLPGVNLRYYEKDGAMEYDLVLQPGADPHKIVIEYDGIDSIAISPLGNLEIHTAWGILTERPPIAFQEAAGKKQPVGVSYRQVTKSSVTFALGPYDPTNCVVIDPVIDFGRYLGGSGTDIVNDVSLDISDAVYCVGSTTSANFPNMGDVDTSYGGGSPWGDGFITRFSWSGDSITASAFLGGAGSDICHAIAIDKLGYVYVVGQTNSANFPIVNAFDATFGGGSEAFLVKLSPDCDSIIFSTFIGGSGADAGRGLVLDSLGRPCVVGYTTSSDFPVASAYDASYNGGTTTGDVFLTKFTANGSGLVFSTYLGGSGEDRGYDCTIDPNDNIYVVGFTTSSNFPLSNPYDSSFNGAGAGVNDAFVAKFSPSGSSLSFSTFIGGTGDDRGYGIALGSDNSVYMTGMTTSLDFPTVSPYDATYNGGTGDCFVTHFSSAGNTLLYSTYLGGSDFDNGWRLAVYNDSVAVVGSTQSTNFPTLLALDSTANGDLDAFFATLNSGGGIRSSSYFGGSGLDEGLAIDINPLGLGAVGGRTGSPGIPGLNGTFGTAPDGFTHVHCFFGCPDEEETCTTGKPPNALVSPVPANGEEGVSRLNPLLAWRPNGDVLLEATFDTPTYPSEITTRGASFGEPVSKNGTVSAFVNGTFPGQILKVMDKADVDIRGVLRFEFLNSSEYTSGTIIIACDLYFNSFADYDVVVTEQATDTRTFAGVHFGGDKKIKIYDENDPQYIPGVEWPYKKNSIDARSQMLPHRLLLRFNTTARTYDVYFNGEQVLNDNSYGVTDQGIGGIEFRTQKNALKGSFYLDNLLVTRDHPCATAYDIYLGTPNASTLIADDIDVPTFKLNSLLQSAKTYKWQVVAKNGSMSLSGPTWEFETDPSDEDGPEVGIEWVNEYEGTACGGIANLSDNRDDRDDDAKGLASVLVDKLAWQKSFDNGNSNARATHWGTTANNFVDAVDLAYFSGVNGTYLRFSSPKGDCALTWDECASTWGDGDLEWIAIHLNNDPDHYGDILKNMVGCFGGIHVVCLKQEGDDWDDHGKEFARRLAGEYDDSPYSIGAAWYYETRMDIRLGLPGITFWRVYISPYFAVEEKRFFGDKMWNAGRVHNDVTPDGDVFIGTIYGDRPNGVAPPIKQQSSVLEVTPGKRGPTVFFAPDSPLSSNSYAGSIVDSLPTLTVVPRTVDQNYVRYIADGFCGRYGIFCGEDMYFDSALNKYAIRDHTARLFVDPNGGFEFVDLSKFMVISDSQPNVISYSQADADLNLFASDAGWLPTDAVIDDASVFRIYQINRTTGDTVTDSTWDYAVYSTLRREVAGHKVVGPGAVIQAGFGDSDFPQSIRHGGWRDVNIGSRVPVISLQEAASNVAHAGSDAVIGGMPPCDSFIVIGGELGYYEPRGRTEVASLEMVWLIAGVAISEGDSSNTVIIARATELLPSAVIEAPSAGEIFSVYDSVKLDGSANYGQAPYQFAWSSDVLGSLGTGQTRTIPPLPSSSPDADGLTHHIISLTVTDAASAQDMNSRTVAVSNICIPCKSSAPLGVAILKDTLKLMKVSNIGASGYDGVSIRGDISNNLSANLLPVDLASPGQGIQFKLFGQTSTAMASNRAPQEAYLAGFGLSNTGGTIQITGDFTPIGDPNVQIAVYNGNTLVGSTIVLGGGVIAIAGSSGNGVPQVNRFASVGGAIPVMEIGFDRVGLITAVNSVALTGNRIRLISLASSQSIAGFTRVDITGKFTGFSVTNTSANRGICCLGFTGNVDCDPGNGIDISDLSRLVDFLYVSFSPLCCDLAANIDGDPANGIDISDLSWLVDYLYVSFTPPAACQ